MKDKNNATCCFKSLVKVVSLAEFCAGDIKEYYAIILRGRPCNTKSGCRCCDYHDGTVSFYSPKNHRQDSDNTACIPVHDKQAIDTALLFSDKLLSCSEGTWRAEDFSFFNYYYKESLHVSQCEKRKLEGCMQDISEELSWGVDKYSCRLILRKIETMLLYCKRFFDRQFLMRNETCKCIMSKIDTEIDKYIATRHSAEVTMEATSFIAENLQMSGAYLADYIMSNNGYTMQEYMHHRQIETAKRMMTHTGKSMAQISKELGFSSTRQMTLVFQSLYGITPREYRELT